MERVLEPEVMDSEEEARDYDAMDHHSVNVRFADDLFSHAAAPGNVGSGLEGAVLDVGTGTALIPIELCSRQPDLRIVAIDLASHMLSLAAENVRRAGLQDRIMLESVDAKRMPYASGSFGATVSNSIVHHIPEPASVLAEILRVTAPGGIVFVRDLCRPATAEEIDRLVERYAGDRPSEESLVPAFLRQRELFRASLGAALTVEEISALAVTAGMPSGAVQMTSDRHWTLAFRKA